MWSRGQSANPAGRQPQPVKLDVNAESVVIPALRRREPACELIKLADASKSERFKLQVWQFLFQARYSHARVTAKAPKESKETTSDVDLIKALESKAR